MTPDDDPDEIARRARLVREAALKARAEGRCGAGPDELTAALGDEGGLDTTARRRALRDRKRYGITSQAGRRR